MSAGPASRVAERVPRSASDGRGIVLGVVGLALVVLLLGYSAAGLIGGAIPVNGGWTQPEQGVEIWVESNGIHTGIVVPKVAAGVDWRPLAKPEHLADPRYAGYSHLSFGWGERAFYLETPTWAEVKPATRPPVGPSRRAAVAATAPLSNPPERCAPTTGPAPRRREATARSRRSR